VSVLIANEASCITENHKRHTASFTTCWENSPRNVPLFPQGNPTAQSTHVKRSCRSIHTESFRRRRLLLASGTIWLKHRTIQLTIATSLKLHAGESCMTAWLTPFCVKAKAVDFNSELWARRSLRFMSLRLEANAATPETLGKEN